MSGQLSGMNSRITQRIFNYFWNMEIWQPLITTEFAKSPEIARESSVFSATHLTSAAVSTLVLCMK